MRPPTPTRAQIVIGLALIMAGVLVIVPRLDRVIPPAESGPGIYRAASLPADLHVCDRDWKRSDIHDIRSLEVIRDQSGVEPVVVDPRPFAPCPTGPCTRVAAGPCHTVIFVRVEPDGYVGYSLRGGP